MPPQWLCLKPPRYGRFSPDHRWPLLGDRRGGSVTGNPEAWRRIFRILDDTDAHQPPCATASAIRTGTYRPCKRRSKNRPYQGQRLDWFHSSLILGLTVAGV